MKFNDAFWSAIAAASPVVALATTFLITDTLTEWLQVKPRPRGMDSRRILYCLVIGLSLLNLLMQASLFFGALYLLDKKREFDIGGLVSWIVALGLILVFVIVCFYIALKYQLKRQEADNDQDGSTIESTEP